MSSIEKVSSTVLEKNSDGEIRNIFMDKNFNPLAITQEDVKEEETASETDSSYPKVKINRHPEMNKVYQKSDSLKLLEKVYQTIKNP